MNHRLAIQTWLIWGTAASLAILAGRNPFWLALLICAVLMVRSTHATSSNREVGWPLFLRGVVLIGALSVIFNVMTVRSGDRVIVRISERAPVIHGVLTWNAVMYGLQSAAVLVAIALVWVTVGGQVSWSEMARILPDRLTGFAVAGAAALNLIPQTISSISDIRESSAARGMAISRTRGWALLVTPVINVGLDRSMHLAEVLEARGFGHRLPDREAGKTRWIAGWTLLLAGAFCATYGVLAQIGWLAVVGGAALCIGLTIMWFGNSEPQLRRTRYRTLLLRTADWMVIAASLGAVVATATIAFGRSSILGFEPYPVLTWPQFSFWLAVPSALLAIPAVLGLSWASDRD
jgi:energy-coupling factor transport system permease protein